MRLALVAQRLLVCRVLRALRMRDSGASRAGAGIYLLTPGAHLLDARQCSL